MRRRTLISGGLLFAATGSSSLGALTKHPYVRQRNGKPAMPVVAIDNVCAWPNLTVLRDGTIIATIHNKPSHLLMAADVECWASTDQGKSWQKRGTPARSEPMTNRGMFATGVTKSGDLLVVSTGHTNKYPQGKKGRPYRAGTVGAWVSRSSDGGRTWKVDKRPANLHVHPSGAHFHPYGDIVSGKDGALRIAAYTGSGKSDQSYVFRSNDDGKSWSRPTPLHPKSVAQNETSLLHLGNGEWLAVARLNGLTLYRSSDDARSWKRQGTVTGAAQHPGHLMKMKNGTLLLTYGNRTKGDKGVDVRRSTDQGKTWSKPARIADFAGDGGYPSTIQLPAGELLTAYYARRIKGHDRYHMGVVRWVL